MIDEGNYRKEVEPDEVMNELRADEMTKEYESEVQKDLISECPSCSGTMIQTEGCDLCTDCGYSSCS